MFVAEIDEVLRHAKRRFVAERLDVEKVGAELRERPHDHGRDAALLEFAIGSDFRFHTVNRREKNTVDPPRDEVSQNSLLSFPLVPRVMQNQFVVVLERALLDGHDDPRKNRVGGRGDDETKQLGFLTAQAPRSEVGSVAHALGQVADAQLGFGGNVGGVAQCLGDGHHGDAGFTRDVF